MKKTHIQMMIGIVMCSLAAGVFGVTLVRALWIESVTPESASVTVPLKSIELTTLYPKRLSIPSLHIDAHVEETGLTTTGAMGTPMHFADVAWYRDGTVPGDMGSAVMDGHVDNGLALAGVFKHLDDIQPGADIFVSGNRIGTTTDTVQHFVVTAIDRYEYRSTPTERIFNDHSGRLLKLITCGGTWVAADRTYDRRIVVTSRRVN